MTINTNSILIQPVVSTLKTKSTNSLSKIIIPINTNSPSNYPSHLSIWTPISPMTSSFPQRRIPNPLQTLPMTRPLSTLPLNQPNPSVLNGPHPFQPLPQPEHPVPLPLPPLPNYASFTLAEENGRKAQTNQCLLPLPLQCPIGPLLHILVPILPPFPLSHPYLQSSALVPPSLRGEEETDSLRNVFFLFFSYCS